MKALSPFPHDASYDADFANGEIFDTDKPLPAATTPRPPRGPFISREIFKTVCDRHACYTHECMHLHN